MFFSIGVADANVTPFSIVATSGGGQSSNCGASFANRFVATVKNSDGVGIANISVTFTAPATGPSGTFASSSTRTEMVVTGADGKATSSAFTANATGSASSYNVVASTGALTANFALTNNWTWFYYLTSLALPAWWRNNESSGVTVFNHGSIGSALDLTATAWTMAQAGQLGAGEAGLADGVNTRLQCANNAMLAGYTAFEWAFLFKPSSAGEANVGIFMRWADDVPFVRYASATTLTAQVKNTVTAFTTTTTTAPVNDVWQILFFAYDNAGDRKIHLRLGVGGAVTEFGYSAQNAMTGTYAPPTGVLNLCNRTTTDGTLAGLLDETLAIGGRTFTDAERLKMTQLAAA